MNSGTVKMLSTGAIVFAILCYFLTGILVAMLLFHPPSDSTRWILPVVLWVGATVMVFVGSYFRVKALKEIARTKSPNR